MPNTAGFSEQPNEREKKKRKPANTLRAHLTSKVADEQAAQDNVDRETRTAPRPMPGPVSPAPFPKGCLSTRSECCWQSLGHSCPVFLPQGHPSPRAAEMSVSVSPCTLPGRVLSIPWGSQERNIGRGPRARLARGVLGLIPLNKLQEIYNGTGPCKSCVSWITL